MKLAAKISPLLKSWSFNIPDSSNKQFRPFRPDLDIFSIHVEKKPTCGCNELQNILKKITKFIFVCFLIALKGIFIAGKLFKNKRKGLMHQFFNICWRIVSC